MERGSVTSRRHDVSSCEERAKARGRHSSERPRSAADLLAWYDRHRRALPWRAPPGESSDPYRVWLSEIMLQQTTVRRSRPISRASSRAGRTCDALAAAPLEDVLKLWAGLGYYARARNLHACARAVVERHGGHFPPTEAELAALPGHRPLHRGGDRGDRVRRQGCAQSTAMRSEWWRDCLRSRSNCPRRRPRIRRWRKAWCRRRVPAILRKP